MTDPLKSKDIEVKPTSSDQRYLEKLEFNPELNKTWLNFFVSNFRVVIFYAHQKQF